MFNASYKMKLNDTKFSIRMNGKCVGLKHYSTSVYEMGLCPLKGA